MERYKLFSSPTTKASSGGGDGEDTGGNSTGEQTGTNTIGDNTNTSIDYSSGGVFSWIAQGLSSIISNIAQGVSYINPTSNNFIFRDFFSNVGNILSFLNPTSENFILKNVISGITNVLSYINPSSPNFFGLKILNDISSLLQNLFVPSQQKLEAIHNIVSQKFAFVDTIKTGINSLRNMFENVNAVPSFSIDIPENRTGISRVTVIDFSWYAPYKNYGDLVITALTYVFFLWRIYIHLPNILHGIAGTSDFVTDIKGGEHSSWYIKGQSSFFGKK